MKPTTRIARAGRARWLGPGALLLAACTHTEVPGATGPAAAAPVAADGRERGAGGAEVATALPPEPREPPRLLTDPGSGVAVVWAGAAAASAVAGAEVVVVEPDLQHVSAYDWRDGEPRWRTELPVSAAVTSRR